MATWRPRTLALQITDHFYQVLPSLASLCYDFKDLKHQGVNVVILLEIIHGLLAISLIVAILLHSGKGTGLSSAFGGALPSTFSGTSIIEKNLNRITVILAVAFGFTSLVLYYITQRGGL
jgi:preprotein translocase subunit SecG